MTKDNKALKTKDKEKDIDKPKISGYARMHTASDYTLNTAAVDRLVNASAETAPEVSEEELRKYKQSSRFHFPTWLKASFIKFWFAGAACFFFFWGLGTYLANLDLIIVLAVALGFITDLLCNNLLRFLEKYEGEYDKWMMFPKRKKFWTLPANVIYSCFLLYGVMYSYSLINLIILSIKGVQDAENEIALGVEPLLFGLLYLAFDLLCLGIKNLFIRIVNDAKIKNGGK